MTRATTPPPLIEDIKVGPTSIHVVPASQLAGSYLREDFFVEYEGVGDLRKLESSVTILPFLLNVAPIIWATGQAYAVPDLDPLVEDSLDRIRSVFAGMYPDLRWKGRITSGRAPQEMRRSREGPARLADSDAVGILFTGGIDSTHTSLTHLDNPQLLLSVWGTDLALDNHVGWRFVRSLCRNYAEALSLEWAAARCNVRDFLRYDQLDRLSSHIPSWWLYAQHGLGLAGIAIPVMAERGVRRILFSAGRMHSQRAALGAGPQVEGQLSWQDGSVSHVGDDLVRHAKVQAISEFIRKHPDVPVVLRVCYTLPYGNGGNCCRCEKCLRTMAALAMEGVDPRSHGFPTDLARSFRMIRWRFAMLAMPLGEAPQHFWRELVERAGAVVEKKRIPSLGGADVHGFVEWLAAFDLHGYARRSKKIRWLRSGAVRMVRRFRPVERTVMKVMGRTGRRRRTERL